MAFSSMVSIGCFVALLTIASSALGQTPSRCSDNQLVGTGIVLGLRGTGDKFSNAPFAEKVLRTVLDRNGLSEFKTAQIEGKVALVVVTTKLKFCSPKGVEADAPQGLDLQISSIGDATSLEHGALMATTLNVPDGLTYAMGWGALQPCPGEPDGLARHRAILPIKACIVGGGIPRE